MPDNEKRIVFDFRILYPPSPYQLLDIAEQGVIQGGDTYEKQSALPVLPFRDSLSNFEQHLIAVHECYPDKEAR